MSFVFIKCIFFTFIHFFAYKNDKDALAMPPYLHNHINHGFYIGWYLINSCARKDQSLLFDLNMTLD